MKSLKLYRRIHDTSTGYIKGEVYVGYEYFCSDWKINWLKIRIKSGCWNEGNPSCFKEVAGNTELIGILYE